MNQTKWVSKPFRATLLAARGNPRRMTDQRAISRGLVVDALRRLGRGSRQDLVLETGMSRATLVKLLPDLIDSGLVVEDSGDRTLRAGRTGRRPATLSLDPEAGAIVCVALRGESIEVAIADMAARLLFVERQPADTRSIPTAEAFDWAAARISEAIAASGVDEAKLLAIGLSVPAPIDRRSMAVVATGVMRNWKTADPVGELRARLPLPILVENDANLAALGELRFGAGRGRDDFIYVLPSAGIGSALVLNGRLYRGATGIAGEIAHTVVDPAGALCSCGNRGCLEVTYDLRAQLALLRPLIGDSIGIEDVVRLVHERDRATMGVIRDAGSAIGRVLAGYCNELNPSAIIFGGEIASVESPLLDGVRQAIDRFALPAIADEVELVRGTLGEAAELIGAAAMVIESLDEIPSSRLVALHRGREARTVEAPSGEVA
jgi:predicted NBD/HSP70 family sugar kinase